MNAKQILSQAIAKGHGRGFAHHGGTFEFQWSGGGSSSNEGFVRSWHSNEYFSVRIPKEVAEEYAGKWAVGHNQWIAILESNPFNRERSAFRTTIDGWYAFPITASGILWSKSSNGRFGADHDVSPPIRPIAPSEQEAQSKFEAGR